MKKFLSGFLCATLIFSLALSAIAISSNMTITVDPLNIQVNGETFVPKDVNGKEVPVFAYQGTTYAPLRALAEAYGLEVGYDAAANMATVTDPDAKPQQPATPDTTASGPAYSDWGAEELGFQVEWNEKDRQIEVDTKHKVVPNLVEAEVVAEQGVIPDEATALAIGKVILEAATRRSMEYQDGERELRLTAHYYEGINAWIVYQTGRYEGRMWYGTNLHRPYVVINKNTGEVISIDLYPQAELRTPLGRRPDGTLIWPEE